MSLENGDTLTSASHHEATVSNLYTDAYQPPKVSDSTKIEDTTKVSLACDPYWDMVGASENLRRIAAHEDVIGNKIGQQGMGDGSRRMATLVDALHNVTSGLELPGGRPQDLQQALRDMAGTNKHDLAWLQTLLQKSMHTHERGVALSLTTDKTGQIHLHLARKDGNNLYSIDVTPTSSIATTTDRQGNVSSIGSRQALDNILPLTPVPLRPEI